MRPVHLVICLASTALAVHFFPQTKLEQVRNAASKFAERRGIPKHLKSKSRPVDRYNGPPPAEPHYTTSLSRSSRMSAARRQYDDFAGEAATHSPALFVHRYMQSGPSARTALLREPGFRAYAKGHLKGLDALAKGNPMLRRPVSDLRTRLKFTSGGARGATAREHAPKAQAPHAALPDEETAWRESWEGREARARLVEWQRGMQAERGPESRGSWSPDNA